MMKQDVRAKEQPAEEGMSSMKESSIVIHLTLLAIVMEETVRIMMDTAATSSYVCTELNNETWNQASQKRTTLY